MPLPCISSNFFFHSRRKSVYDEGIPYLEKVLGPHENRVKASPVFGSFVGLPPLCICVSKHEVVFDQAMLLAKRAKEQGVDVTVGVWKYM
jgi:acetyl esterase/lipase